MNREQARKALGYESDVVRTNAVGELAGVFPRENESTQKEEEIDRQVAALHEVVEHGWQHREQVLTNVIENDQ